jgi:hypothetical protein
MSRRAAHLLCPLVLLALASLSCQAVSSLGPAEIAPQPTAAEEPAAIDTPQPTAEPVPEATRVETLDGLRTPEPVPTEGEPGEAELGAGYADEAGFYTLSYPDGWLVEPYRAGVHFWADESGATGLDVALQIKALSAEALADEYSAFFSEQFDDYEETDWHAVTLSGYEAIWVEQAYEYDGTPQLGFMATVVRNRVGLLLFAYAPADDYEPVVAQLQAMVQSLTLTEFDEAPAYTEWLSTETEHFVFHYLPGTYADEAIDELADEHEQAFEFNLGWLGVDYQGPLIDFYFYPSYDALYAATARDAGFALNNFDYDAAEVHAVWESAGSHQSIGHELTHVLTYWSLGGDAGQALLGEGVAVCLDHNQPPPHVRASALLAEGELLPLADILDDAWFDADPAIVYPESGSLACWLLERYGEDNDYFEQIYGRADFEAALEEIYGFDLEYLEEDWLTMLEHN